MKKTWSNLKENIIKRKKLIITVSAAAVLLFGGVAGTAVYAINQGTLSEKEAIKLISGELGGEVVQVEKEWDEYPVTYDMTVKTEEGYHEVEVDAKDGKVLSQERDDDQDEDALIQEALKTAKISMEEAEKIALKQVEGQITDLEADMENGSLIYEVEIKQGPKEYDVDIDANTGKVLKMEMDD
ncbi:PepSY domain-containing protein [Peribacillus sp. NPDC097675]|uniref:PepSY domain-containing protein n=1 Tax=Peribacillus sp. NPDC097675 TaxID=3390618 RepID=UPI003CFBFE47